MEILAIIGGVILGLALIFGSTCLESWLLMLAVNWLCSSFGIAFCITFWQMFIVLFILNVIGKCFRSRTTVKK